MSLSPTEAYHARKVSAELIETRPPQLLRKLSAFHPDATPTPKSPSSVISSEHTAETETDRRVSQATFGTGSPSRHHPRRWSAFGGSGTSSAGDESYFPAFELSSPPSQMRSLSPRKPRPMSIGSSTPSGTPETDHAIQAHLMRSSSMNTSRIVPKQTISLSSPPSKGTPLSGGVVERSKSLSRGQSKLDKVLGQGAETARVILEIERRAQGDVQSVETTPLPPPPGKRHQQSASQSTLSPQPAHSTIDRQRAGSFDSLTSLRPSLNDSINTLTHLIPPVPIRSHLSTTKDLNTNQRALLLRRARKLEQVLGETLQEAQVGEHIVEPAGTVIDRQAWPGRSTGPEWDAEDVVPHRASESGNPRPAVGSSLDPFSSGPPARFGGKAVAAITRAVRGPKGKAEDKDGLEIYVARERVVVTKREPLTHTPRPSTNRSREVESAPVSPVSVLTSSTARPQRDAEYDSDEEAKRERRVRIAKLHRLLGTTIPPAMVPAISRNSTPVIEKPSPLESAASFMSFDDRPSPSPKGRADSPSWTSRLMPASRKQKSSSDDADGSFMHVGERMSEKDKQVARRRANKLEHVFGTLPPAGMFVTSSQDSVHAAVPPTVARTHARSASVATYDTYHQSIQGLLYLVEHDQDELGRIVDELASPEIPDKDDLVYIIGHPSSPDPSSPILASPVSAEHDPESFTSRRKRAGKLSHFFGEARVGIDSPCSVPVRKSRKDVLDGMLGDVWKGAQAEAKIGTMKRDELERLSTMMGTLRRRRATLQDWDKL